MADDDGCECGAPHSESQNNESQNNVIMAAMRLFSAMLGLILDLLIG
jgi:hypothetical protein